MTHPKFTTQRKENKDTGGLLEKLVLRLQTTGLIIDTITLGLFQFMGVCRLSSVRKVSTDDSARRIDIKLFPIES